MKALWSLEILEAMHLTTQYHIPEDMKLLQHNFKNQKSCKGQNCFDKCWNLKGTKTSQACDSGVAEDPSLLCDAVLCMLRQTVTFQKTQIHN